MDAVTYYAHERDRHFGEARLIVNQANGNLSPSERARADEHTSAAEKFQNKLDTERENAEMRSNVDRLTRASAAPLQDGSGSGSGLYGAMQASGFDRELHPSVMVPFDVFRPMGAATFDGDYEDAVASYKTAPLLGADRRHLYTALRIEGVESDTTSVSSFRQKARTLPSPLSLMVRDIDAVTAKPETATQAELVNEPMHQIATVETDVPNVMLESQAFRSWIDEDLRFAYSSGVDAHVIAQIDAANPATGSPGEDWVEAILLAAEEVASAGYNPTLLAASPEDLISLQLQRQPSGDDYLFSFNAPPLGGLRRVAVAGLVTPYIIDAAAAGVFYTTPVRVGVFEQDAGATNSSTVRIESNGVFVVQRLGAIAEVVVGS